jgi:hypothetical protein
MEVMVIVVVLAILLVALMFPRQYTENQPVNRADELYEDYLAWKFARELARNNTTDNSGCLGLLVVVLVAAALLAPLLMAQ